MPWTQGPRTQKENRLTDMEIGLTGQPLTTSLPGEKPAPLYYLLQRLERSRENGRPTLQSILDCLEFLERYFTGYAAGLLRKLEDTSELSALIHNAKEGPGLRRLLKFSFERLSRFSDNENVIAFQSCFFLHGKRSLPIRHARWLGLAQSTEDLELSPLSSEQSFSYSRLLETLSVGPHDEDFEVAVGALLEVLLHWLEHAYSFFADHKQFARLDESGWQCTLQRGETFVELNPPLPSRLIPLEAQAPTSAPQTEDEYLLEEALPSPDVSDLEVAPTAAEQEEPDEQTVDGDHSEDLQPEEPKTVQIWSTAELKSFQSSLRQLYSGLDLERVPKQYLNLAARFLSSVNSGYILIEGSQGRGKTLMCHALQEHFLESGLEVTPLLFSVKNQFYPDPHTFLEQLNEHLRIRPGQGQRAFEALDPQVIRDLNRRTTADARSARFSAYMSELSLVNGTRIVLILDGIDEGTPSQSKSDSLFSYLPPTLPDGVYLVVAYDPERFRAGDRDTIVEIKNGPSTELTLTPHDGSYRDLVERFLNRAEETPLSEALQETIMQKAEGSLAAAQHMLDGLRCQLFEGPEDLPPPSSLYERLFDRLYERVPDRYLDLFLLLATSDEPVSGQELSNLGIPRTDVLELVFSLPSLFHCYHERGASLNLAHRAIRLHLQRTFLTSYAQSCGRLAKRALQRFTETELAILPVRDELDRLSESVRRLLRWSIDSQNRELLAEVCQDPQINKLRHRIFSALEDRSLYHRKTLLLDTFLNALKVLVDGERREEFREELAWSLSSRALSYNHLGHYHRALIDIETAIAQFQILVEDQGNEGLRNGLAAAFNRRSEILRALEVWERALPDADRAVQNYQKVVDSGRQDLASLLMLSLHNRGIIYRNLQQPEQATRDLEHSLNGYLRLVDRDNRRELRPQLASVYQAVASLALSQGQLERALSNSTKALDLYETLVHRENFEHLRNELAAVYNDRGAILSRTHSIEEAERDYASAIAIRTYLVAEGRIDIRPDLAQTYANRGLCLVQIGDYKGAEESFDRSVEILDRLIEEERREELYAQRAFALSCRAHLHRHQGRIEAAREDYSAAAGDYRLAVVSQGGQFLEELALTLNSLAEICLLVANPREARRHSERVLEIYERQLSPERRKALTRERAIAHHNFAESLSCDREHERAEAEFQKAIDLLTDLIENEGRPDLTGELASSLVRFAELSSRSPERKLKMVSRALAFLKRDADSPTGDPLQVAKALSLRASIFSSLDSPGAALDDITSVLEIRAAQLARNEPIAIEFSRALAERARLFCQLSDLQAAEIDLNRARLTLDSFEHLLPEIDLDIERAELIAEHICLLCLPNDPDLSRASLLLRDLDRHLSRLSSSTLPRERGLQLRAKIQEAFRTLKKSNLDEGKTLDPADRITRIDNFLVVLNSLREGSLRFMEGDFTVPNTKDQLRLSRAWTSFKSEDYERALEDFQQVSSALPKPNSDCDPDTLEFIAEVESGRGAVLDSLDRADEAINAYTCAVDSYKLRPESGLSPKRAASLTSRARLFARIERYQEALDDIDTALEIARSIDQKAEVLARWEFKASVLKSMGRHRESLSEYKKALEVSSSWPERSPELELALQWGVYRLSASSTEKLDALLRALVLLRALLKGGERKWREEASRIFQALPLPEDDLSFVQLEGESLQTLSVMLESMEPGHTPLVERLLRRASLLETLTANQRMFRRLATGYACLATKFCLLEYEKYGASSLPRLVRCYLLVARYLVTAEAPPEIAGLGDGLLRIAQDIVLEPPTGELEVEINNLARLWQSLPPSKVIQAGASRATLQALRRW